MTHSKAPPRAAAFHPTLSSLQPQLLPYEHADLRELGSIYDLQSSLPDCLARVWNFEDAMGESGAAKLITGWSSQYPQWNEDQLRFVLGLNEIRQAFGLVVSTARRILKDDPWELAAGEVLAYRLEWLMRRVREQSGMGTEADDLGLIPLAMAVRDSALAGRMLEPRPSAKDRPPLQTLLDEGVAAAFRRELPALRAIVDRMNKRKIDRSVRYIAGCLTGIAEGSPVLVAAALQESLDDEARARAKKQARNIVCIETHAFYRLAEWVSSDLVAAFDITQGLPWDAGFHAWTDADSAPLASLDLAPLSPQLHRTLIHLELPAWFRVLEGYESPWDTCRVILEAAGPHPRAVEEVIGTWCRMRRWDPVDLQTCPTTVGPPLPRHEAFQLRRFLLEAGAIARFVRSDGITDR